ncbi:PepSY domain-containing protein [Acidovorax sp. ACV01]|uniref:PepSY domain-containing protein n=1 Tax=Acidovorax sp. ACV01 TaxID=2769311 RepID=UPI00177D5D4B|nr:PepSY domain-containing protein [Acidovorax sp. ACV01]MBD9394243.1 PepSY domain-containing protein [Acidovorax sp. ACV01]
MVKKLVIFVHKWLGVVLALFFLMWFVSGVVLYFVPFPSLTQAERLAALPPLQLPADCCLAAPDAAQRAGLRPTGGGEARLGMLGDAPVWRMLAASEAGAALRWHTVDARTGAVVPPLSDAQAATVAEAFSGRRAMGTEWVERDQWTVPQGLDAHRPLVKVLLDGDDGLELYVSTGAAEVVRDTRRAERFWNWLGAVPHWIYPTVLRQFPKAWHHVVVWLSIPGVLLAATGIALGIWQLFLNRRRWIPYQKFWMRWHHILGLVAAVFTLTWMFSGLMSMNPFGVFTGRAVDPQARTQWAGEAPRMVRGPAEAVALAAAEGLVPLEVDTLRMAGQAWYRVRGQGEGVVQRLVRADGPEATVAQAVPDAAVLAALQGLRPGMPAPSIEQVTQYDGLYYARHHDASTSFHRPLPVWRAHWAEDEVTVYADAASARIVMRADASTPWQRLLYNGLHSLDFAPLLARPALRTTLIVGLSLLGVALCITSCVVAWRVLVPRRRRAARSSSATVRAAEGAWTA